MTRITVFPLLCVLCITSSFAFVFEDCGSEIGKMVELSISSCTDMTAEKCVFTRGSDVNVNMKFSASKDVSEVTALAFGVMMEVPIPFPLEKPKICSDPSSGVSCPLKKDQEYQYKSSFAVEKKTPPVSIEVMWEFRSENDEKILCVKFPVKIQ
ncbi:NPC intracellular cholesterol transporter 2 homolog a [Solenopsis invicta]|uniref:NPC intracellular cholesterol transporter 2 homolog a n=1 Tax=Solenopsis invicta TaxID=13686 RepID=UPI000595DF7B|nr:NPC intracellular cholesterol transporter 2 homolog a [Solenopsis invicta]